MGAIIGIDLGTTFSVVAQLDETGRPVIVHNEEGVNMTPSCVTESDGAIIVGAYARQTYNATPELAVARFKRKMGSTTKYKLGGHEFTPTQLSTFVLKKLKQSTEQLTGPIQRAVVTIPANFSSDAREATLAAAKGAGLQIDYIINEPTAAALYYAYQNGDFLHGHYAVYDLGGGTFDVSIISVEGQDVSVVATNGVAELGGDDFDDALRKLVLSRSRAQGHAVEEDDYTKGQAETDKISLSGRPKILTKVGKKTVEVTRAEFEEAVSSKIAQAEMLCEGTLEQAGLKPTDIRGVFLAGGSTRIPVVRTSVTRVFGQEPIATANVDEVVALGAALYAAYKGSPSALNANQRRAVAKLKVTESTGKCFGTLSFGDDEARGGRSLMNTVLIAKGTPIPLEVVRSFYTMSDGQEGVNCTVTESNAPETDPRFVRMKWEGKLQLPPGRPAGQEIKVAFAYDDNQIMKCRFTDTASGRSTEVDIAMTDTQNAGADAAIERFMVE